MRFGCCVEFKGSGDDLDRVAALAEMGFQFIEPPVAALLVEEEPQKYYAVRRAFRKAPLVPEAFHSFIPDQLRLVGDDVDWRRVERYVAVALERVREVGGRTVVFDSARARRTPEGFPLEEAWSQVRYLLAMAADYAGPLTIAVEPLPPGCTNLVNTLEEAATLVAQVGRPPVRLAANPLHVDSMGEPWQTLSDMVRMIAHVHCCDRDDQMPGTGGADLEGFFAALTSAGYDGRVSLQCSLIDVGANARAGLEVMKALAGKT